MNLVSTLRKTVSGIRRGRECVRRRKRPLAKALSKSDFAGTDGIAVRERDLEDASIADFTRSSGLDDCPFHVRNLIGVASSGGCGTSGLSRR